MGNDSPLLMIGLMLLSGWVASAWWRDARDARQGFPNALAWPGATPVPPLTILLAMLGAVLLLAAETLGEYRLGVVSEQSRVTWLFGAYSLAAAIVEEVVFRGYLAVTRRGPAALWISVVLASLVFAGLHPFLWVWRDGHLTWLGGIKGWFSTGAILTGSLWFYTVRFWRLNPAQSLWPCFAAHLVKNLGVLIIKYAQGYISGWW